MKKLFGLILACMCCVLSISAQRTVTGMITDNSGEAMIGANVLVDGSTLGTITDIDGSFSLSVPDDATKLLVSYTGYSNQTVDIVGINTVSIILAEGQILDEIVMTATGISRNSREITYANQTVSSDQLNSAPNKNALEALRGKAAGVKITTGSGSVGASNRIVLRGESSLTGNNNALIVVDGIPINNSTSKGGATTSLFSAQDGYADYGNRFNDLNPEDIESVTVLKGASATAIYGSRGASGVLVITTKKGANMDDGEISIGYSNTTSLEKAYVQFQRQDQFGQGFGLPFSTVPSFDTGENWSWGPRFDGVVRPWTSPVDADGDGQAEYLSRPFSAVDNQLDHLFNIGRTFVNNVNVSGRKGGFNFYSSYGNTKQFGIFDNTDYTRHSIKFAAGAKMSEKLNAQFSVNYANVDQNTTLEGYRPFEGQNAYANAVQSPVNIPFNELRDYNSPFHDFGGYYGSYTSNPFFILNEFENRGVVNNFLGSFQLNYEPIENLNLMGRVGANFVNTEVNESTPVYAYEPHIAWENNLQYGERGNRANNAGEYFNLNSTSLNTDYVLQASYKKDLNESGSMTLEPTVGYNLFKRRIRSLSNRTVGGLTIPGWYDLNNAPDVNPTPDAENYWIYGIYGQMRFGLDNKLFLDYSIRQDNSSTLPVGSNSFLYQSIGASAVVSDYLDLPEGGNLNYLKLRASYGTTGKDAPIYRLYSTYVSNPTIQSLANGFDVLNSGGTTVGNRIGNPNLKPELTTTLELGVDGGFFNNRVNLEYTYYTSNHSKQLVDINLAPSSGFSETTENIGRMTNKGHEVHLNLKPLEGVVRGLAWDIDLLYSKNINKVIEITDPENDGDELVIGALPGNINIVAKEGLPFGSFKGAVVATDDLGRTIVDATGLPILADDEAVFGSYQPDFLMSYSTTIGYKGFAVNVLLDQKKGGQFLSYTKDNTEFNGTALTTLINDREAFVVENSVVENGDGTFSENMEETNPYDYLRVQPLSTHLIDASFIKLRELGLTYTAPRSLINKLPVSNLTVGIFGKNLKFWLPEENTFADPEVNGPDQAGNATGVETTQTPPSKSYGVRLSVNF